MDFDPYRWREVRPRSHRPEAESLVRLRRGSAPQERRFDLVRRLQYARASVPADEERKGRANRVGVCPLGSMSYQFPPTNPPTHIFHPPFNRIPTYREPGKINLNTIYSQDVWNGLMNDSPDSGRLWQAVRAEPAGIREPPATGRHQSRQLPTRFARPFRSSAAGTLAPQPF